MSISRCRSDCDVYRTLSLQPFHLCTFYEALTHQLRPGTAQVNRLRRSSYLAPLPFLRAPMDNNLPTPSLNVSHLQFYQLANQPIPPFIGDSPFIKASPSDVVYIQTRQRRRRRATFCRRTSGVVISWPVRQHLSVSVPGPILSCRPDSPRLLE
ncbi:hypothetical protein GE21DRAFT_1286407 [Neurospora crassa]|nr:hypothetical protein GE21DRAFT_1286407 [Neurospora crassa]